MTKSKILDVGECVLNSNALLRCNDERATYFTNVAFSCRFPVASLSPLALSPSCRLHFPFLSLILSQCLVFCCFPVISLSPPCRRPVACLLPSCRTSPVAFLSPACRFLSLPCRFPAAFLLFSCRHPVVFLSPPCRLPVAPGRILPSPASRGPNLLAGTTYVADAPTLAPETAVRSYPKASGPGAPKWVCALWHDMLCGPRRLQSSGHP